MNTSKVEIENGKIFVDGEKNFSVRVSLITLEKEGWYFDFDTKEAEKEGYDGLIEVKGGHTYITVSKLKNGIVEEGDKEKTGDDDQTMKDLIKLYGKGDLFSFVPYYY